MATKVKIHRDVRNRIWHSVLGAAAKHGKPFTIGDIASASGLEYTIIGQIMHRLKEWGYIRHTGFAPGEGGVGRQRHVFEVTGKGRKKAGV